MFLVKAIKRFFSADFILRKTEKRGEIPSDKDAYKLLITIAAPSILEMVFSSLVGAVDTAMVGNLGKTAVAAVGLTTQPKLLAIAIFFAINAGTTAVIARRKGEGNREDAIATLRQSLLIAAVSIVIFITPSFLFAEQIMKLAGADATTLSLSTEYFQIVMVAGPFQMILFTINSALRGIGDTKTTMVTNVVANIVNVIFNYLLIEGHFGFPALGVRGAAIATSIGVTVAFFIAVGVVLNPKSYLSLVKSGKFKLRPDIMKTIARIGGNSVVEQIFLRVGFFVTARFVANLGMDAFASHQIGMQVMTFTFTIGDGLGVAATALVGQNLGKARPDLSALYAKIAQRFALSASCVLIFVIILLRFQLAGIFIDDPAIIAACGPVMVLVALAQPFQTSQVILAGSLRGAGDTRYVAFSSMLTIGLYRPVMTYVLAFALGWGLTGVWITVISDQILRIMILGSRFASEKWTKIAA